jgi:hypothetical protein
VRNYITTIYEHFGVKATAFATRRARWKALVALTQASNFIG